MTGKLAEISIHNLADQMTTAHFTYLMNEFGHLKLSKYVIKGRIAPIRKKNTRAVHGSISRTLEPSESCRTTTQEWSVLVENEMTDNLLIDLARRKLSLRPNDTPLQISRCQKTVFLAAVLGILTIIDAVPNTSVDRKSVV